MQDRLGLLEQLGAKLSGVGAVNWASNSDAQPGNQNLIRSHCKQT